MSNNKTKYSLTRAIEEILYCLNGRKISIETILPDVNDVETIEAPDVRALRVTAIYSGTGSPDHINLDINWDRASQSSTINLLHPDNTSLLSSLMNVKVITSDSAMNSTNESMLDEICQADWEVKPQAWWDALFSALDDSNATLMILPMMSGMIIGGYNCQGLLAINYDNQLIIPGVDYTALKAYYATHKLYSYFTCEIIVDICDSSDDSLPDGTYDNKAWFFGTRDELAVEEAADDGSKSMIILSMNQYNGINNNYVASASPSYIIPNKATDLFDSERSNNEFGGGQLAPEPGQLAP